MKVKIRDIIIGPRQRLNLGDIDELAESLKTNGQLHNIGITPDNRLIYGRRRLAAATLLGWEEIDAVVKEGLTETDEQVIELEEDIKRLDRTWQEQCIAMAKLFSLKSRQARKDGKSFTQEDMGDYLGVSRLVVKQYAVDVAMPLLSEPRDEEVWNQPNFSAALQVIRGREEKKTTIALEELHRKAQDAIKASKPVALDESTVLLPAGSSKIITPTPEAKPLSLRDRAMLYNKAFEHLGPPNTELYYSNKNSREFITGLWFLGGGNISEIYGSYNSEYLKRINSLFPDLKQVVHLFVGNLPPSPNYVRVGLREGESKPDIECDAHALSSHLPFKADIIFADPPYSVEDSEHYSNAMVNRQRVLEECALSLAEGGYVVWLDQGLPVFRNELLEWVGAISYIRSTANRYRVATIFRKRKACQNISSEQNENNTKSPSQPEQLPTPQAS